MTTRTSQDVGKLRHMIILALALFCLFVCCVFYRAQAGCPMLDLQVRGSALPCEWSAEADTPRDGRRTRTPFVGAVRLRDPGVHGDPPSRRR